MDTRRKLNRNVTWAICRSLNSHSDLRSKQYWESLVGFTLNQLIAHLESLFRPGMTWENRKEWHIDHIKPLALFDFETPKDTQFKEAWALKNLQPLWAKDNLSKGAKYSES